MARTKQKLEGDGNHLAEDSYEYLKMETLELRQLLLTLTTKYKTAEDKRKVTERRNSILINDNTVLQHQLLEAQKKRILSEKECSQLQSVINKLMRVMPRKVDGSFCEDVENILEKDSKSTSCTGLAEGKPHVVTVKHCESCKKKSRTKNQQDGSTVVMTKQELAELDVDMKELRGALQKREDTWSRTAERERTQRLRLNHLTNELKNLKNLHTWKSSELEFKSRELKSKTQELTVARREILQLKAKLLNGQQPSRAINRSISPAYRGISPAPRGASPNTRGISPAKKKQDPSRDKKKSKKVKKTKQANKTSTPNLRTTSARSVP